VDVRLSQIGPGEYEQAIDLRSGFESSASGLEHGSSGSFVVTLSPRRTTGGAAKPLLPVIGGVTHARGEEYRRLSSDIATLKAIADATGGRVFDLAEGVRGRSPGSPAASVPRSRGFDLFSREGVTPAEARTPLWPMLAVAAVVLLLLDVGTRRVAWDRLISREMGAEVGRGVAAALRDRTVQSGAALDRLRAKPPAVPPDDAAGTLGTLGETDAEDVREREQARRREARSAARREARAVGPDTSAGPLPPRIKPQDVVPQEPEGDESGESGLRAAKRRAQKRMEE
jgi:hypothetical protein